MAVLRINCFVGVEMSRGILEIAKERDDDDLNYLETVSYTHLTLPTKRIV